MFNSPQAILKGAKVKFTELLATKDIKIFDSFTEIDSSKNKDENYPIFMTMQGLKQFIDKISFADTKMKNLNVVNYTYYDGFEIDFDTMSDSEEYLGKLVNNYCQGLAALYAPFKSDKINTLLAANGNWVDGTAFFATSRSNLDTGSNTFNNLQTGTLSSAYTYATASNDFALALAGLRSIKDKNGVPLNPDMSDLVCLIPSQHEAIFEYMLKETQTLVYSSGTISNQYAGRAKIVVNPFQSTSDNDWYLINMKAPFKPFFVQERQGVNWTYNEDKIVRRHQYYFDVRFGAALLNPAAIQKVNN